MATMFVAYGIAPETLKLMLLAYGMTHSYRIVRLEEICLEMSHIRREEIERVLEQLALEGLVTRFARRYCFNRPLPSELRQAAERLVSPSGTVRIMQSTGLAEADNSP